MNILYCQVEIFGHICSYCDPGDYISLAKTCKFLYREVTRYRRDIWTQWWQNNISRNVASGDPSVILMIFRQWISLPVSRQLRIAARMGYEISFRRNLHQLQSNDLDDVLEGAAWHGHAEIVEMILSAPISRIVLQIDRILNRCLQYPRVVRQLLPLLDSFDRERWLYSFVRSAVDAGYIQTVRILLDYRSRYPLNLDLTCALTISIEKDDLAILQLLLQHKVPLYIEHIAAAIVTGNLKMMQLLLQYYGPDLENQLGFALFYKNLQSTSLVHYILETVWGPSDDQRKATLLSPDSRQKNVALLFQHGIIIPEEYPNRVFEIACQHHNVETCALLLDPRYGLQIPRELIQRGLLQTTFSDDYKELAKLLLRHGATINREHVQEAIRCVSPSILQVFIDHGLDVTREDDGYLLYALLLSNLNVVEILLKAGADPTMRYCQCIWCAYWAGHVSYPLLKAYAKRWSIWYYIPIWPH